MIDKIISGGQTGVDRAALDTALINNIPHGGWCPAGRRAEDGPIDTKYALDETAASDYAIRTEWNVRDSDGTLILNPGRPEGGTALTIKAAKSHHKPCLIIDLDKSIDIDGIVHWLYKHRIRILNIAGPRESKHVGIHNRATEVLDDLIKRVS